MMWWGHDYGWEWTIFGGLMMLLFWGGLLTVIVMAVRAITASGSSPAGRQAGSSATALDNPLNILKTRYARGEITQAEYEEIRDEINRV